MPRSPRRRSAVALASLLALAAAALLHPATAGAADAASNVKVVDPTGDTPQNETSANNPKADIIAASARYQNDHLTFTMKLAEGDDLSNPEGRLFWFATTSPGGSCCAFWVSLKRGADALGEVVMGNPDDPSDATPCEGSVGIIDASAGTYAATVPASCIESLASFHWGAYREIPDVGGNAVDRAPDGTEENPLAQVTNAEMTGYWAVGSDGKVYPFGDAPKLGEPASAALTMIDIEATPPGAYGTGYWTMDAKGIVTAFGPVGYTPGHYGNASDFKAEERAVSLSATPTGAGYWIFTNKGRAIAFGDANKDLGDVSTLTLNGEILDSAPTPTGNGYYLVGSDGGVFTLGDAVYQGSMGDTKLNQPVQSIVPDPDGEGYWLVASDGGVFTFKTVFKGSMGAVALNKPMTGMVPYGDAYLMVAEDGGVFNFSNKPFEGSLGANPPANPVVSITTLS